MLVGHHFLRQPKASGQKVEAPPRQDSHALLLAMVDKLVLDQALVACTIGQHEDERPHRQRLEAFWDQIRADEDHLKTIVFVPSMKLGSAAEENAYVAY